MPMAVTHDIDRAEDAARRLDNYIRAARINGHGDVEQVDDGLALRATLYEPSEDDIVVMRRVPQVGGLDVRILVVR